LDADPYDSSWNNFDLQIRCFYRPWHWINYARPFNGGSLMKNAYQYMIALPLSERTENVRAMVDIILTDAKIAIQKARKKSTECFSESIDTILENDYIEGLS
jgi:hypothetical protein